MIQHYKNEIENFMHQHGYFEYYMGFLNKDDPSVQAYFGILPLNPETFTRTLDPYKTALMERFRQKSLQGKSSNLLIHNEY